MRPIPILVYHQVDAVSPKYGADGSRARFRSLTVPVGSFARQMWALKAMGYRGVSMSELMPYLRGEKQGKVVGNTFDDGYRNNLTNALPVLKRFGFSSTCYVVSGMLGKTNSWDLKNNVVEKPLMTAEEVCEWISGGQEVGSHTRNHVNLSEMDAATARDEIRKSKEELEALTGTACRHFCYPYGSYTPQHVGFVQEFGYESATTTARGKVSAGQSPYELARVPVLKSTMLPKLCLEIL